MRPSCSVEFRAADRELDLAADAVLGRRAAGGLGSGVAAVGPAGAGPPPARTGGRRCSAGAIVIESRRTPRATLHPRWSAAVTALAGGRGAEPAGVGQLREWVIALRRAPLRGAGRGAAGARHCWSLCRCWSGCCRCRVRGGTRCRRCGEVDQKVLARVRALLAKAESTEFPDEAEALSAKAQELMSRYSLQQAVLEHDHGRAPAATGRRLWMDAPYAGAKVLLVQAVATANRCRTVWRADPGFVTVVGPDTELDIVELLTHVAAGAGEPGDAGGRPAGQPRAARRGPARSGSPSWSPTRPGSGSGSPRRHIDDRGPGAGSTSGCCRCWPRAAGPPTS